MGSLLSCFLCVLLALGVQGGHQDESVKLWEDCRDNGGASCINMDCSVLKNEQDKEECELMMEYFESDFNGINGGIHTEPLDIVTIRPRFDADSIINPNKILEWQPVAAVISPGEKQQYQFPINTTEKELAHYHELLIFITANICTLPTGASDANDISLYYGFSQDLFYNYHNYTRLGFDEGYLQGLAQLAATSNETNLYLLLIAKDDPLVNGSYSYELGISQNDLVFQWDDRTWLELLDSDDNSALFVTGNLTTESKNVSSTESNYKIHIFSDESQYYFNGLNKSWCAIKHATPLIPDEDVQYSFTSRGQGIREQMYVQNLNSSTNYIAYVSQDYLGSAYGGSILSRLDFRTQEPGVCQLLFNLTFCDRVAYSVPKSTSANINDADDLALIYDTYAQNLYTNFSFALQQVACDAEDDARYSPIVTCEDCAESYKEWLCGVTIPRCATTNRTGYIYRDIGDSRNDFLNHQIVPPEPYYEVLPCIGMCHSIVRDCPPVFGFQCPTTNATILQSYAFYDGSQNYTTCNYMGSTNNF